jgi:16S rRNA C967 or C1407 C5-methylase (RsmB/RsmF family)
MREAKRLKEVVVSQQVGEEEERKRRRRRRRRSAGRRGDNGEGSDDKSGGGGNSNSSSSSSSSSSDGSSDSSSFFFYDRVLVDAPCTHDGSFKHVAKLSSKTEEKEGGGDTDTAAVEGEAGVLEEDALMATAAATDKVAALLSIEASKACVLVQRQLLLNGFRRLRSPNTNNTDGPSPTSPSQSSSSSSSSSSTSSFLVYSTCSLTQSQNEGVVAWLLDKEPTAKLVPIEFAQQHRQHRQNPGQHQQQQHGSEGGSLAEEGPCAAEDGEAPWAAGGLPHTLRFTSRRGTSGLFIAKITKVSPH